MWLSHGNQNQWPAALFHRSVTQAIDEDRDMIPMKLSDDEIRDSYLLVLLGVADPAGQG